MAIVTPRIGRGGPERVIAKIARHFDADIFTIFYNKYDVLDDIADLNIIKLKIGLKNFIPKDTEISDEIIAYRVFSMAKIKGYDIYNPHASPSQVIREKNFPVLWYAHSPTREMFNINKERRGPFGRVIKDTLLAPLYKIEKKSIKEIEYVFSNSMETKRRLRLYFNRDSEVLYPGVDVDEFYSRESENYFLISSRIAPRKNIEMGVRAFNEFYKRNKGWKLIVVGALNKDRKDHLIYYERIKKMMKNGEVYINIDDEKLKDLYSKAFAVIYTPINEDFGLVPLESFASKKPVIGIEQGGLLETVEHGKDGYLADSYEKMAEYMEFLAKNEKLAEKMGKKGYEKVKKKFSWNIFLKKFESRVSKIINEIS